MAFSALSILRRSAENLGPLNGGKAFCKSDFTDISFLFTDFMKRLEFENIFPLLMVEVFVNI